MRVVTAAEIDALLAPADLMAAIDDAFRGEFVAPKRHHFDIERPGATASMLLMPAWTGPAADPAFVGTKVVTVYPDNAARGLASVLGSYLLMDGASGLPLAVMDGTRLTLHRTAATSALAARRLARPDATDMVMVGAGALAPFFIRAHAAALPKLARVSIWNHRPERAVALARELASAPGLERLDIRAAADLEAAVRGADLISAATLSREPLVRGAWLKPGAHVDLVGAYNLAMREADDEALARASVFIDTPAALIEGGDVAVAIAAGTFREQDVVAGLAALADGRHPGRTRPDEITLFKSIGASLEDLAAAMLVWKRLSA